MKTQKPVKTILRVALGSAASSRRFTADSDSRRDIQREIDRQIEILKRRSANR